MNMREVNYNALLRVGRDLLLAIGEDPEREGVRDTPRRFADMWREFIEYDPGATDTSFGSVATDQIVVVSGIRVWSICEHHTLPFWCDISIGYIPHEKVLGLSKFARIAHKYAHRLQLQERLCQQIADEIMRLAETEDVAVLAKGEHLCMVARGIRTSATMISSVMRGVFREKSEARLEFLRLVER
jgi:GTP cyclohydrolase I